MFKTMEDAQKFSKDQMDAASTTAATLTKGVQDIAVTTTDYSKKSFEQAQGLMEKMLGVKTLDKALEIQTEFAKSAYEGMVAQSTKVGELYTSLFKEAFKPVEMAYAKVQAAAK